MHLVAVDGAAYSAASLRKAITDADPAELPCTSSSIAAKTSSRSDKDYHGGLRYPKLERVENAPDRLDDILAPSK